MSTSAEPTKEQIEKLAQEVREAKQAGFITQLVGRGKSASEVRKLHALYKEQDAKREAKFAGVRSAILGE